MLPIPFFYTRRSTWSGTYSQPNFLWYDYSAATASTNTNEKNTVLSNGSFTRAWDFSGNSRHSDSVNQVRWIANQANGKSGVRSATQSTFGQIYYTGTSTGTSSQFTIIVCMKGSTLAGAAGQGVAFAPNQTQMVLSTSLYSSPAEADFNLQSYCWSNNYSRNLTGSIPDLLIMCGSQSYNAATNVAEQTLTTEYGSTNIVNICDNFGNCVQGTTYSVTSNFGSDPTCFDRPLYSSLYQFGHQCNQIFVEGVTPIHYEFMVWDRLLTQQEQIDVFGYLDNKYRGL